MQIFNEAHFNIGILRCPKLYKKVLFLENAALNQMKCKILVLKYVKYVVSGLALSCFKYNQNVINWFLKVSSKFWSKLWNISNLFAPKSIKT